jgi:hypothetical protein
LPAWLVASADRFRLIVFSDIASLYAAHMRATGGRWGEAVDVRDRPRMLDAIPCSRYRDPGRCDPVMMIEAGDRLAPTPAVRDARGLTGQIDA